MVVTADRAQSSTFFFKLINPFSLFADLKNDVFCDPLQPE